MGLVKVLLVSAAGIWSARTISRLNHQVSRIPAPALSSLVQSSIYKGDFYADTFVVPLPNRVAFSNIQVVADDVARAFFRCQVFSSFEKPLLKLAFSLKEPQLKHIQFHHGEKVLLWSVAEKNREEVLLEWSSGGFRGFTWLHISADQRYLMLGSSIGYSGVRSHLPLNVDVSPTSILIDAYRRFTINPYEESILERLVKGLSAVAFSGIISVHQFYSRLLLKSTLKSLVLEEEKS